MGCCFCNEGCVALLAPLKGVLSNHNFSMFAKVIIKSRSVCALCRHGSLLTAGIRIRNARALRSASSVIALFSAHSKRVVYFACGVPQAKRLLRILTRLGETVLQHWPLPKFGRDAPWRPPTGYSRLWCAWQGLAGRCPAPGPEFFHRSIGVQPPLPPILNAQGVSKVFGAATLFQNVWFTVSEADVSA